MKKEHLFFAGIGLVLWVVLTTAVFSINAASQKWHTDVLKVQNEAVMETTGDTQEETLVDKNADETDVTHSSVGKKVNR